MDRKNSLSMGWRLLLVVPLACLPSGCGTAFSPPPEAVLSGTWTLTTPSSVPLTQLLLTFDRNGTLTTIAYKLGADITITTSSVAGTTKVTGKDVSIATAFLGGSLEFNGTLNDADTEITGTLTTQITVGTITVTINGGPGTLTKQ